MVYVKLKNYNNRTTQEVPSMKSSTNSSGNTCIHTKTMPKDKYQLGYPTCWNEKEGYYMPNPAYPSSLGINPAINNMFPGMQIVVGGEDLDYCGKIGYWTNCTMAEAETAERRQHQQMLNDFFKLAMARALPLKPSVYINHEISFFPMIPSIALLYEYTLIIPNNGINIILSSFSGIRPIIHKPHNIPIELPTVLITVIFA